LVLETLRLLALNVLGRRGMRRRLRLLRRGSKKSREHARPAKRADWECPEEKIREEEQCQAKAVSKSYR
jgi:hypothetical protein